ncbi:MAG TPA: hypothetical protein VJI46_01320 [Candidatus Nanoarchaeia archaeon]|nr:hypothetical protein [Candidatus Nanoarchaeia archaeon]
MNIKKTLLLVGAALHLVNASAQAGSLEVLTGNNATTVDAKLYTEINPNVGIFLRNRLTDPYQGSISGFGVADLVANFWKGDFGTIGGVAEALFPYGGKTDPRLAVLYSGTQGPVKEAVQVTGGLGSKTFELWGQGTYSIPISEGINLESGLEFVSNFGVQGHNFSRQSPRLGIRSGDVSGLKVGVGADVIETPKETKFNVGVFGEYGF